MKNAFLVLAGLFLGLLFIAVGRTLLSGSASDIAVTSASYNVYDSEKIAKHLSRAITFKTISDDGDWTPDAEVFGGFADFLATTYPAAHSAMERERVNGHSLVLRWPGAGAAGKKPIAFLAHLDVVPIETGTEGEWAQAPFSGVVKDGLVWGRGALDNKGQIIALMEAAERLAAEGFTPSRDVYFLFGHDEEIGGGGGAAKIVKTLAARGVRFAWTMDEGSGLVQGIIPGVEKPVALISTAEKGSVTLKLTARGQGGHSSTPAPDTAVSILSRAVLAVNDNPHPLKLDDNVVAFMHALAGEMAFAQRLVLTNMWLTGPIVKKQLSANPLTAASLHTTTAPTMIDGGQKLNILPQQASAIVNYRIHPRDSVASVRERAERLINDERVTVEIVGSKEPSPQSSATSEGYQAITKTTALIFGDIPVAPTLTLQGTDSHHYMEIADDNYRFTPFIYQPDDLQRMHGTDERINVENLARAAAWYEAFIRDTA